MSSPRNRHPKAGVVVLVAALLLGSTVESAVPVAAFLSYGAWLPETPAVLNASTYGTNMAFGMDDNGGAFALWRQYGPAPFTNLMAARYVPGQGWESPVLLAMVNSTFSWHPSLAVNGSGGAFVVWQNISIGANRAPIEAARYISGLGWTTPVVVDTTAPRDSQDPQVASDRSGNAIAVWLQEDPPFNTSTINSSIYASRFTPAGGWGTPTLLQTNNSTPAGSPSIAMNGAGSAVVAWTQKDGPIHNVWANRFDPGGVWQGPLLIEQNDSRATEFPRVAIDAGGNATVGWGQGNLGWVARFEDGLGWRPPVLLWSTANPFPNPTALAGGRAMVVCTAAWVALYEPSSGWGPCTDVGGASGGGGGPAAVASASGAVFLVWTISGKAWANRFTPSRGWGGAVRLENLTPGCDYTLAAADAHGGAMALCQVVGASSVSLWSIRFDPTIQVDGPELFFTAPADGTHVATAGVPVMGMADLGVRLTVAGLLVDVAANGSFSLVVALKPGTNVIEARAVYPDNSTLTRSITVYFDDPIPGLEADLAAARLEADALAAQLQALADSLATLSALQNDTSNRAAATEAELAATEADLNATRVDLNETNVALAAAERAIDDLRAALAAANSTISELQRQVATMANETANDTAEEIAALRASLGALNASLAALNATLASARAAQASQEARLADAEGALRASEGRQASLESWLVVLTLVAALLAVALISLLLAGRRRPPRRDDSD